VLEVLKMLNENDFVQKVEHTIKNRWDFKIVITNSDEPRVGIDRTFNLESFYITSFVNKINRVVRK
jgi:hypothetical protein